MAEQRIPGRLLTLVVGLLLAPVQVRAADVVQYYHLDAIGNVRVVTNQARQVIERHDYLPFGEEWNPQGGTQPRRFTGKERDPETGLDYFGARYYGSKIGRFTTVDPTMNITASLADPQRWNRYAYSKNNPLRYVDPDGRELRTTELARMQQIAGPAAGHISIVDGRLNVSGLTPQDLANNEGAQFLQEVGTSKDVYTYSEGTTNQSAAGPRQLSGAVSNLDNRSDSRYDYKGGKGPGDQPPAGIDASVVVNPAVTMVDRATGTKVVSPAAIAFHELAEAQGRVGKGLSYGDAHAAAAGREKTLVQQRSGFTQGLAGEAVKKQNP